MGYLCIAFPPVVLPQERQLGIAISLYISPVPMLSNLGRDLPPSLHQYRYTSFSAVHLLAF